MAKWRPSAVEVCAALVVGAVLAACSSPLPPSPSAGQPTVVTDAGECRRLIEAVKLTDDLTIRAADACRYTAAGEQAAREVMASPSASIDQLWAGLWVYAASASDPAPLVAFANHADLTLRAMASVTMVAFGERAGFAPLGELLTDSTTMTGSRPPLAISSYVANGLFRYVSAEGVPALDEAADAAAQASAWQAWLAQNAGALQYSATDGVWMLP